MAQTLRVRAPESGLALGSSGAAGRPAFSNPFFRYEGQRGPDGRKNGRGKLVMGDGWSWYEGEFVDDEIEGSGVRVFPNGDNYTGEFHAGEMHGAGTLALAGGGAYTGAFRRNRFHGAGALALPGGGGYEGGFAGHKFEGRGRLVGPGGDEYVGEFAAGRRHGLGTCRFANGDVYEGAWCNDVASGQGRLVVAWPPLVYEGAFEGGRPEVLPSKLNAYFLAPPGAVPCAAAAPPRRGSAGGGASGATAPGAKSGAAGGGKSVAGSKAEAGGGGAAESAGGGAGGRVDGEAGQLAEWQQAEPAGPLQVVAGQPLPVELVVAAQRATVSAGGGGALLDEQAAGAGGGGADCGSARTWRTAATEFGRAVMLTLQRRPPEPLAPGRSLSVMLCCVERAPAGGCGEAQPAAAAEAAGAGGEEQRGAAALVGSAVRVELHICLEAQLSSPLPLDVAAGAVSDPSPQPKQQERITGLPVALSAGVRALQGLALGARLPVLPTGSCCLVMTSPGVMPGFVPLVVTPQPADAPAPGAPATKPRSGGG
ncbi:MAG: hypothetical protein J3K34DRAFT_524795 [Monoraphidium minutum]|nr:MAG: hypothetical protein J3K34DRAFT_524795 [Monoraphidium minutum]